MQKSKFVTVNQDRLWQRLMRLGEVGATPSGGVNRQAMTKVDGKARAMLLRWGMEAGLHASMDPIGNFFLRKEGSNPNKAPILSGSHLDTQPNGGKFDGAFGVLAALEALTVFSENDIHTNASIDLVVWNNEEGCRFKPTTMGSATFTGDMDLNQALATTDVEGICVADALDNFYKQLPEIKPRMLGFPVGGYLEAHIEQGPVLERKHYPVGIVESIQGLRWFTVEVLGQANHAGTTPQRMRRDALTTTVKILDALQAHFRDDDDVVRFTVGRMLISPNAPNTIPERVQFTIDFRHPDTAILEQLGDMVPEVCKKSAGVCEVKVTEATASPPINFNPRIIKILNEITEALGLPQTTLPSGATHDAKWLSRVAPSGMIFVPCKHGISHSEQEEANPSELASGATVLANALLNIAD